MEGGGSKVKIRWKSLLKGKTCHLFRSQLEQEIKRVRQEKREQQRKEDLNLSNGMVTHLGFSVLTLLLAVLMFLNAKIGRFLHYKGSGTDRNVI